MNKKRRGFSNLRGFSYIETVLALLIMSIALFPTIQGFRQAALNQAYAEGRYRAQLAARNLTESMAAALRRSAEATQLNAELAAVFSEESGNFPEGFYCLAYVTDKTGEAGYKIFGEAEPEAEEFIPPTPPESGIEKREPDLRIAEEISSLNGDISAEEKDGRLYITFRPSAGKDFYYISCEGEAYSDFYFEKQAARDIFVEAETEEGREISMEAAEGIYVVRTQKEKESGFVVLDVYDEREDCLLKRFVRFL